MGQEPTGYVSVSRPRPREAAMWSVPTFHMQVPSQTWHVLFATQTGLGPLVSARMPARTLQWCGQSGVSFS